MNTGNYNKAAYDAFRYLYYTGISGTPAAVGSIITVQPRSITYTNETDVDLLFSYSFNGTQKHLVIPSKTAKVEDIGSNRASPANLLELKGDAYVWVSAWNASGGSPNIPTLGYVAVTIIYATNV